MATLKNALQLGDDELRALIGRQVRYMGKAYEITDVLLDDGLMILSAAEAMDVQEDSYGRPHRMVRHQHHLHFRDADKQLRHIWDDLIFLDGPRDA